MVDRGRQITPDEPNGLRPGAPSVIALDEASTTPNELTEDRIDEIVRAFADAAQRALAAGFEVVELHGAHGYLIHQFLVPYSNHRADAYGGPFEARTRFALEVVEAVRAVWPAELPVFFRISATDWLTEDPEDDREGWTTEDTVRFAKGLPARGEDLMDVFTGGNVPDAKITVGPHYQVPCGRNCRDADNAGTGGAGVRGAHA